jgi:hypothetical protein
MPEAGKKQFNHRWTRMNTDEARSEGRSGLVFRRSLLNGALSGRLENHVYIRVHLSIRGFKSVLLNRSS